MKAYVLQDINKFVLSEIAKPVLKHGEVMVQVKAAGICGSDIPRIYSTGTYSYPLIPGHEFSGIVVEVGVGANKTWEGKRVGVFPLVPCMSCDFCRSKSYELCRNYSYLGSRTNGGFAEFVAVPQNNLIILPEEVSFEAAAMLEPMAVVVHAIRKIELREDDTVAVLGLGTIGVLLTMFLKKMGVKKVLAIGNKDYQRSMVEKLGVLSSEFCNVKKQDMNLWLMEQTDGKGAGVFFECVGRNETVNQAIMYTSPNGKVQMVGNPSSDMVFEKNLYWKILRNQLTIKGSWNSTFTHDTDDDWNYVLDCLQNKSIDPEQFITNKLGFEELEKGLRIMKDKAKEYIKVMILY